MYIYIYIASERARERREGDGGREREGGMGGGLRLMVWGVPDGGSCGTAQVQDGSGRHRGVESGAACQFLCGAEFEARSCGFDGFG